MIRTFLIVSLFALSGCAGTDVVDRGTENTVYYTVPGNCDLAPRDGGMGCDFVSEDGRDRRILAHFNDIEASDSEAAEIASMNAAETTEYYRELITGIDARRRRAKPAGYSQTSYRLLTPEETPPGFTACAKSRDVSFLSGDGRSDRAHLHCWLQNTDPSLSSQFLFSYSERNDRGTPVSARFEGDANAVLSTVWVDRP